MSGRALGIRYHLLIPALATGLLAVGAHPVAGAPTSPDVAELPACADVALAEADEEEPSSPWQVILDEEGGVSEHRLTLRRGTSAERQLRVGRRGFALAIDDGRLLVGERTDGATRLAMVDTFRACRLWQRRLDGFAYPLADPLRGGSIRLSSHDPLSRRFDGVLELDVESGDSSGLIDGECIEACVPNDGDVSPAALLPAGAPRPVPNFNAGGWPKDTTLRFRWKSGAVPPAWAMEPLEAAADDATTSAFARSPRFTYGSSASNALAYSGSVPSYCGINGIACAARVMPDFWAVWLRPDGTDYAWGSLRWCQKTAAAEGCFDIRRVALHELGHIAGLNHPSSAGFTLAGTDSVMQAITPMRPNTGAGRHAFGACDVATLQELYDTPDHKTAISSCNDVATTLRLRATKAAVGSGESVKLKAWLEVEDQPAYRQLRANPLNGRSVKLKFRRAGSSDAWQTAWMEPIYSEGRYEATLSPTSSWEFQAVFPTPADEGLRDSRSELVKVKVSA